MEWHVILEPVSRNHAREEEIEVEGDEVAKAVERNDGGLAVFLTNGVHKREVSRVAFVRRNSSVRAGRKVSFKKQLRQQVETAEASARAMNDKIRTSKELAEKARIRAVEMERAASEAERTAARAEQEAVNEVNQMQEAALV